MRSFSQYVSLVVVITLSGCAKEKTENAIRPPVAEKRPFDVITTHGQKRTDPYYWLRERTDSAVIAYLNAENQFTKSMMDGTQSLQDTLIKEMKSRIKEEDTTAPIQRGDYFYYQRYSPVK